MAKVWFTLGVTLVFAWGLQSQSSWQVDYSQPAQWTRDNAGNQIQIRNNRLEYQDATDGSNRRMYRPAPAELNDSCWQIDFTFRAIRGGVQGATGTLLLGLTQGADCPLNTCGSTNGNAPLSNETGLLTSFLSQRYGANVNFQVRVKVGQQVTVSPKIGDIQYGNTFYLRLKRWPPDSFSLAVYQDSARRQHLPGSPVQMTLPPGIKDLKYLQHSTFPQGYPDRKLTGWIDDVSYRENDCNKCPEKSVWQTDSLVTCLSEPYLLRLPASFPGRDSARWSNGARGAQIAVSRPGLYSVKIDSGACQWKDSLLLESKSASLPPIRFDTLQCYKEPLSIVQQAEGYDFEITALNRPRGDSLPQPRKDTIKIKLMGPCDTSQKSLVIEWRDCRCRPLVIPNSFTPNDDGLNETWQIKSACPFTHYQIIIKDRWGHRIFQSQNPRKAWNGRFKNKPVPQGTYYYFLRYQNTFTATTQVGSIQVIY